MICPNPQIVAARLIATRNIFLRQQLCQIANEIQRQYDRRLPLLHLVTTAVYEQVFYRQPLSLPEEIRQEAVKFGIEYYKSNEKKLLQAESANGLAPSSSSSSPSEEEEEDQIASFDHSVSSSDSQSVSTIDDDDENTSQSSSTRMSNEEHERLLSPTSSKSSATSVHFNRSERRRLRRQTPPRIFVNQTSRHTSRSKKSKHEIDHKHKVISRRRLRK